MSYGGASPAVTVPQPATVAPPAVAMASDLGSSPRYALENHTHMSTVQARRVAAALTSGKASISFPNPYADGVTPVVSVTAETPDGAAYKNDATVIEGSITNAGFQVYVMKVSQTQTLPGVLTSLLGLVLSIFAPQTGSVYINYIARAPSA